MRAMRIVDARAPLEPAEVPVPEPGPGELLLRVRACGLNFADTLMVAGRYQEKPAAAVRPRARGLRGRRGAWRRGRRAGARDPGRRALRRGRARRVRGAAGGGLRRRCPRRCRTRRRRASSSPTAPATSRWRCSRGCGPARPCWSPGPSGGVGLTAVELGSADGRPRRRGRARRGEAGDRGAAGAALDARPRGRRRAACEGARRRRRGLRHRRRRLFDACLRAAQAGGAAAADRLRRRRGAADPGEPAAGEEPDRVRLLLRRLGRGRIRPRRAPASRRLFAWYRARAAAPARRPRAAARGGRMPASTCCGTATATGKVVVRIGNSGRGLLRGHALGTGSRPGGRSGRAPRPAPARGPSPTYMLIR